MTIMPRRGRQSGTSSTEAGASLFLLAWQIARASILYWRIRTCKEFEPLCELGNSCQGACTYKMHRYEGIVGTLGG